MSSKSHSRYYLLTTPRSASNMLIKVFNLEEQPNIVPKVQKGYFFANLFFAHRTFIGYKPTEEWTDEEKAQGAAALQPCFDAYKAHLEEAEAQGKDVFIKEHPVMMNEPIAESDFLFGTQSKEPPTAVTGPGYTRTPGNPTVVPDEILKTFCPTFLIRHPAIAYPSHCRTIIDLQGPEGISRYGDRSNEFSGRSLRMLYDWFCENLTSTETNDPDVKWPIVLDTDDVLAGPEVVVKLSKIVGFDPEKLKFSWEVATAEEVNQNSPLIQRMLSTLSTSTGVMNKKLSVNLNIDDEAVKWRKEFGEEIGAKIEKWVRDALPDYEYLREKKMTVIR